MGIFNFAVLDSGQTVVELLELGTDFSKTEIKEFAVVQQTAHGGQHHSGSAGGDFSEFVHLFQFDFAAFSGHAQVLSHLHEGLVGHRGQNGVGKTGHILAVFGDGKEVAGVELIHIGVGGRVQEEGDGAMVFMLGGVIGQQTCGIVAGGLDGAGAVGYVLMGLTILVAFKPFYQTCGLPIVLWVVGEGIAYITGAVLYSFKKVPYIHSVFHVFVILGDICHMIATWKVIQLFIIG